MYVNDPISDMLTRIRNAIMAHHSEVAIPYSKMKEGIARILKDEGFVLDYKIGDEEPFKWIHIELKYVGSRRERTSVMTGLKRISKPGRRVYAGYQNMPWVLSGMGIAIVTTPQGVMTDQQARRDRVGGEILCHVW
jgi:small subunit ribosomal protein S8